jgi:hypothetical protein
MLENWKPKRVSVVSSIRKSTAVREADDAKGGREAAHRRRERRLRARFYKAVVKLELLEVVEGGGPKPAIHDRVGVVNAVQEVLGDGEAATRTPVRG